MSHRVRRWRALTVAVGVALGVFSPSCSAPQRAGTYAQMRGARLEVLAAWSGTEQARFTAVLRGFSSRTGAVVTYASARQAAGDPPDVALLPQPGLLRRYAQSGRLVPLDDATVRLVRRDYAPVWQ